MIDVTQQVSKYPPHQEEGKSEGASFGIRATCVVLAIGAAVLAFLAYQERSTASDIKAQLTQSNSELAQTRSDLDRAKAQAGSLQSNLDKAAGLRSEMQSEMQSKLDAAMGRQNDLQAQLQRAQSRESDLQFSLEKSAARTTDLESQINQAKDDASGLRKQLDSANAQTADLQSQLTKAQNDVATLQPQALKARAMPVAATFEKTFFVNDYTMHLRSLSPGTLKLNVAYGAGTKTDHKSVTVKSGETYDLGGLKAGSTVSVESDGYDTASLTVR